MPALDPCKPRSLRNAVSGSLLIAKKKKSALVVNQNIRVELDCTLVSISDRMNTCRTVSPLPPSRNAFISLSGNGGCGTLVTVYINVSLLTLLAIGKRRLNHVKTWRLLYSRCLLEQSRSRVSPARKVGACDVSFIASLE